MALITGAASGIGRAIAHRFGQEGACISLADSEAANLLRTAMQLSDLGIEHSFQVVDVRDSRAVECMIARTMDNLGGLDVLVTAAGTNGYPPLLQMSQDVWEQMLSINVTGTFLCCQAAAKAMIARAQGGCMITIAAGNAVRTGGRSPHHDAIPGAVVMLTKALAAELGGYGITANTICPYILHRRISAVEGEHSHNPSRSGLRRSTTPAGVAAIACYLASAEASSLTGALMGVNGVVHPA